MVHRTRLYPALLIAGILFTSGCGGDSDSSPVGNPVPVGPGGTTVRVSEGSEADDNSFTPSINSDGRFIAFASDATNLVGVNDTNGVRDIFIRDRDKDNDTIFDETGAGDRETIRVSVDSSGTEADDSSFTPSISSNGRFIAFASDATNLIGVNDTNGVRDVFVRDTANNTTIRASLHDDDTERTDTSSSPSISSDGRYVAFQSDSALVANDINGVTDVFVRDTVNDTTIRVSLHDDDTERTNASSSPSISSDGRYVAFQSDSALVANDINGVTDVFVRDTVNDTTIRVSLHDDDTERTNASSSPSISADGRYVAFESDSPLVADDINGVRDVFVRDTANNTTIRASLHDDDTERTGASSSPSISTDGRYVAFQSDSALVADDTNGVRDVFVRDTTANITTRISVSSSDAQSNDLSSLPSISSDGNHIAFESNAANLITGDANGTKDIFVRSP